MADIDKIKERLHCFIVHKWPKVQAAIIPEALDDSLALLTDHDRQAEQLAAKEAENIAWKMASGLERHGDGGESITPDNLEDRIQQDDSSLTAADALRDGCYAIGLDDDHGRHAACVLCGGVHTSDEAIAFPHAAGCPVAAYSATRTEKLAEGRGDGDNVAETDS